MNVWLEVIIMVHKDMSTWLKCSSDKVLPYRKAKQDDVIIVERKQVDLTINSGTRSRAEN